MSTRKRQALIAIMQRNTANSSVRKESTMLKKLAVLPTKVRTRFLATSVLLALVGLTSTACSAQVEDFVGSPVADLRQQAEADGVSLDASPECFALQVDSFDSSAQDRFRVWEPQGDVNVEADAAAIVTDATRLETGDITYCASLDIQNMPPLDFSNVPEMARQTCAEVSQLGSISASSITVGSLSELASLYWDLGELTGSDPRFMGLERFAYYAYNLYDYANGLEDYLELKPAFSGGLSSEVDVDTLAAGTVQGMLGGDLAESMSGAIQLLDGAAPEARRICSGSNTN